MIKIAIVEDDKGDSGTLARFIRKYGEETGETFGVNIFSDGLSFLADYDTGYDIVFMDIEMPFLDGLKTVKRLRAVDQNVSVIFVTNMAKYAIKGYEVDALDFVVKPVDYFNFSLKMEKAVRLQKKIKSGGLMLNTENGMIKLDVSDIYYIESSLHFVCYHTEKGLLRVRSSMKETEKKFESMSFVRCNNSYLVNLSHVDKVSGDEVTVGNEVLTISRSRKKHFLDALAVYYGGGF